MISSSGHYQQLMKALEWLKNHAGFSPSAGFSWSLRQEHLNRPVLLEIRQNGSVLFTLENNNTLPKVFIPELYAMTFDGENFRLYRMLGAPQLIGSASVSGEAGVIHCSALGQWSEQKNVA
jgi:hypothetical protein